MKKRLRKKLAKKAIEEIRRNICIAYRLPYDALFPTKPMTITGFKLDSPPTYCDRCGKKLTEEEKKHKTTVKVNGEELYYHHCTDCVKWFFSLAEKKEEVEDEKEC